MKKILENIEKDELLEYYRSSSGKFAVGNFVGINNDFAIFTSISPFGRFEGYRFIKIEDLKNIGKKKLYLEFMKKRIEANIRPSPSSFKTASETSPKT